LWVKFSACSGVVDSPSGREIEKINIEDMMKILARDFSEHQILIAGNTEDGSDEIKKK
jgi:hypothetical protein